MSTNTVPALDEAPALATYVDNSHRAHAGHAQILAVYREHHAALVRFASLVAPADGMAEDLVQDAVVRLYRTWSRIDDPARAPAWLRTTILNQARGRGRRLGVARRLRPDPRPDVASAEDRAMHAQRRDRVVACLRRLPPRQRECLVLRHYEGLTESGIADALGISVGSVRTHTTRGTAALRQMLDDHAPEAPGGNQR